MLIVYCQRINLFIKRDHITEEDLRHSSDEDLCCIDIPSSPKRGKLVPNNLDIIIICFKKAYVESLVCMNNILLICPDVDFADGLLIDLSNREEPKKRNVNKIKGFYGLAGHSGNPGFNLSIICKNLTGLSNVHFISTGMDGGPGQNGDPGGIGGLGGLGGYFIINNQIIKTGEPGKKGLDTGINKVGITKPERNNFGLTSKLSDYKTYIYEGVNEYNLEHDKYISEFFTVF